MRIAPPVIVLAVLTAAVAASPVSAADIAPSAMLPSSIQRIIVVRSSGAGEVPYPEDALVIRNGTARYRGTRNTERRGVFATSVDSAAVFAAVDATGVARSGSVRVRVHAGEPSITVTIERLGAPTQTLRAAEARDLPPPAAAAYFVVEGAVNGSEWERWGRNLPDDGCPPACGALNPAAPSSGGPVHRTQPHPG